MDSEEKTPQGWTVQQHIGDKLRIIMILYTIHQETCRRSAVIRTNDLQRVSTEDWLHCLQNNRSSTATCMNASMTVSLAESRSFTSALAVDDASK